MHLLMVRVAEIDRRIAEHADESQSPGGRETASASRPAVGRVSVAIGGDVHELRVVVRGRAPVAAVAS